VVIDGDDADVEVDSRFDQFTTSGFVAEEPTGVLANHDVWPARLDQFPDLVDARARDQFARDFGVRMHDDFGIAHTVSPEKLLAVCNLIVDTAGMLVLGGVPGIDQDPQLPADGRLADKT